MENAIYSYQKKKINFFLMISAEIIKVLMDFSKIMSKYKHTKET